MIDARTESHKIAVVSRLLEYSRGDNAPIFGVWWDGELPKIRYAIWSDYVILSWEAAEEMTGIYWPPLPRRKPMQVAHEAIQIVNPYRSAKAV